MELHESSLIYKIDLLKNILFRLYHIYVPWQSKDYLLNGSSAKTMGLQSTIPGDYCFNGRLDFQGVCSEKMEKLLSKTIHQWLFLVPIKGGRWHSSIYHLYTTYILASGGLYICQLPVPPF